MKISEYVGDTVLIGSMDADVREMVNKGMQIDLAGCHITPDVATELLTQLKNGADIIDSEDKERNDLLNYNKQVIKEIKDEAVDFQTPPSYDTDMQCFKEYLEMFEDGVSYNLSLANINDDFKCALGFMLAVCRPEVGITMTDTEKPKFIKYISSKIFSLNRQEVIKTSDSYFILINDSIYPCNIYSKDLDSPVQVYPIHGSILLNDLINEHFPVPDYFGETRILDSDRLKNLYAPIVIDVRREIATHMSSRKSLYATLQQMQ